MRCHGRRAVTYVPCRSSPTTFRLALPRDARAISALYRQAYDPANGSDVREHYPFPQFLDEECVEDLVRSDVLRWFVADLGDAIVGTCGAVVNIGSPMDRIAESFGLVIDARWQHQSLGTELFRTLCDSLVSESAAAFVMAETRTSHAGGWKVVRHCGFVPMGFEPFAHATPAGSEAMLMTGRVSPVVLALRRRPGQASARVSLLSRRVLQQLDCVPVEAPCQGESADAPTDACGAQARLAMESAAVCVDGLLRPGGEKLEIHEEPWTGRLPEAARDMPAGAQGIIGLRHLEGHAPGSVRYERSLFVASIDGRMVAHAQTSYDHCDQRLRVIELRAATDGIAVALLAHILRQRQAAACGAPFVAVLDARADSQGLISALERIGFFPTVYYPALIQEGGERVDAVQFTWLFGRDFKASRDAVDLSGWPPACAVVAPITNGWQ